MHTQSLHRQKLFQHAHSYLPRAAASSAPWRTHLHHHHHQQQKQLAALPEAAIGIDLGTTNSAIAVFRSGAAAPYLLADSSGSSIIPSVVAYTGPSDPPLVGAPARRQAALNPDNTYSSVKRLIGRPAEEIDPTALVFPTFPASAAEAEAAAAAGEGWAGLHFSSNSGVRLRCSARGCSLTPEQVSADLLNHLLGLAAADLGWRPSSAVITVPAYFTPAQRAATQEAAELAGLKQVYLLQEPVAAAMAYGFGKPTDAETVLVFDLGGGTYDVSVVESFEGIMEVLACNGNGQLGGDDFDRCLVKWLMGQQWTGTSPAPSLPLDSTAATELLQAAERAKVALTASPSTTIQLPGGQNQGLTLTRGQLEELTAPLLGALQQPLAAVGAETRLAYEGVFDWRTVESEASSNTNSSSSSSSSSSRQPGQAPAKDKYAPKPRQLTAVVLVGGASRMPAVQRALQRLTGLQPRGEVDPEAVVALGAATQAGVLEGLTSGVEVMDGGYLAGMHGRATGVAAAGF